MEWLPITILVVLVLGLTLLNDRSAERSARDRVAETERILAAMVEITASSHKHMSGIYAPEPTTVSAGPSLARAMLDLDDEPVMPWDTEDPTDAFLQPVRQDASMGSTDNPFGIPGLVVPHGQG